MIKKNLLIGMILFLCSTAALMAQHSLFDNPDYRRALQLQRMAEDAFEAGDYLNAAEYSREAEQLSAKARKDAEIQRLAWIANSWKNRAEARITFGERYDAAERYPEVWPEAVDTYAQAVLAFEAARYEESTVSSRKVVDLLADISAPVSASRSTALPKYYKVRLIETARDCFWRIAEYPFVYGDPWKWRLLYEANKDKIPDPANPHWIEPGIILEIPSAKGESRSGTWQE